MKIGLSLILLVIVGTGQLLAQEKFTISGTITDNESGEALIGATIYIKALNTGTVTNNYGFFSLTVPGSDSVGLVINYLGYEPQVKKIRLRENVKLNSRLTPGDISLDEVIVTGEPQDDNINRIQMAVVDIPIQNISEIPVILGETDILKVIQLLPGVLPGDEGTTGFYVRGGNSDQNLVQLDEAVVYNPNHLLGLFSTFNSRTIKSATLIKGGFPAQYGGRLSSILDLSMKEGNNQQFHAEGGIGLITSSLTLEGPIKKDKASFIISGRRTYLDYLVKPFLPKGNASRYSFYDLNAKINWKVTENDRLFFSVFNGNDKAKLKSGDGINYTLNFGNTTSTLRWNHIFGSKLFVNTSLIYNKYDQDVTAIQDNFFSQTITKIEDLNGKAEFQYFPNPNHSIRFGGHYINHRLASGGKSESKGTGNQNIDQQKIPTRQFDEYAFYFNDEINLSDKISTSVGLRAPGYVSTEVSYFRLEPRASIKVSTGFSSSIKAAYSEMNQYLHLIPSSTASIPTDVWIRSTKRTRPQHSKQYALGYFKNFANNSWELSVEGYYKDMKNQVLFPEGNQLVESFDVDTALVYGKGWSYGTEFFLKKKIGDFTGWLAYTLSWTYQKFADLNFGNKFPFRYDRRHSISLVGAYQINPRWKLSGAFVYNSGNPYTLAEGRFPSVIGPTLFEGNYFVYQNRNNQRLGANHRLDLSLIHQREGRLFGREFRSEWVLGIYNIYSHQNPYFVYLKVDPVTDKPQAIQVTLLPIIPSVSYNFKF